MFSQIQIEMDKLVINLEKTADYIAGLRQNEYNPNVYAEYGGRLIGITESLSEIRKAQIHINDHIIDILKNTTDGNYVAKLNLLIDENDLLRDKVELLEEDLKKYHTLRKDKEPAPIMKELSEEEIDKIIDEEIDKDLDIEYFEYDDSEEE